jgi:hypothetical protein
MPAPRTVRVADPEVECATDKFLIAVMVGGAYDTDSSRVLNAREMETTTSSLPPTPAGTLHVTAKAEIHLDEVQLVPPTRTMGV